MDREAGSSKTKMKPIISISRAKNYRQSDDYDSEGSEEYYSDEEVYSQGPYEEEISLSSEGSGNDRDISIFGWRPKLKTTGRRSCARSAPPQPLRPSASK
ncbi:hypothetical protein EVAR_90026_1 [Eumeta japonica]|uniref:Uncharacterized protein n=1 Tax=Eumeta variegata TaxID=151549 RepID=A0A4C1WV22_EUMVA|nr:hypothetical protein EVAR_90026_1 [Eumeta japonica]